MLAACTNNWQRFNDTLTKDDKRRIDLASSSQSQVYCSLPVLVQHTMTITTSGIEKTSKFNSKLEAFFTSLKQYAKVLDVYIQPQSDFTAVVWGSMRFLLQVAIREVETRDEICAALERIFDKVSVWERYLLVVPESVNIEARVVKLYARIINFLVRTRAHFEKSRHGKKLEFRHCEKDPRAVQSDRGAMHSTDTQGCIIASSG